MRVADFHFDLPEDLIAQRPPATRGTSRMLRVDRASGACIDDHFRNLPALLTPGDLLILNDSRVLPARLYATRARGSHTQGSSPDPTGRIEVLLTQQLPSTSAENLWSALVRPARKVQPGETLLFPTNAGAPGSDGFIVDPGITPSLTPASWDQAPPLLTAEVLAAGDFGERTLRFPPGPDFLARLDRIGHMPLPPYLHRPDEAADKSRYQTVYAQTPGSAAAPTAGLHFTPEILAALQSRGIELAYITLHVGLGTFQPVRVDRLEDIRLHTEHYTLPPATAAAINRARHEGRRIIAAGTTSTRTLEHCAQQSCWGPPIRVPQVSTAPSSTPGLFPPAAANCHSERGHDLEPHSGSTSIFLSPGYRFKIVSGLLTNFHLPQSTLLMLVAAFLSPEIDALPTEGRDRALAAYAYAIAHRYRFFSYGDCMLIL